MLPRMIYEPLPYFYLAIGGLLTVALESPLKYLPVVLFVCAGLLVLSMRRYFRRDLDLQRRLRSNTRRRRTSPASQPARRVERR